MGLREPPAPLNKGVYRQNYLSPISSVAASILERRNPKSPDVWSQGKKRPIWKVEFLTFEYIFYIYNIIMKKEKEQAERRREGRRKRLEEEVGE